MIKLIVLDVDGCMTDSRLTYSSDGVEEKSFNVKDGLGITTWIKMGHHIAIITGRNSPMVEKRANELGISHFYQGIKDKKKVYEELVSSLDLKNYEVAAIGDDLNDYKMLKLVGRSFTPKDGAKEVKEIVNTVLSYNGGSGAVREMIDTLVNENDEKEIFMKVWA